MRGRPPRRSSFVRLGPALLVAAAATVAGLTIWRPDEPEARGDVRALKQAVERPVSVVHRRRRASSHRLDLYAYDRVGMIQPIAKRDLSRVYVPNSAGNSVDVIDPHTFKIVDHFAVGALPQHITPSHDLKTLYVNDDVGNSLTPIDPRTGRPGDPIPVDDPYNLYFTPNGRYAIVVAERLHRLDFRSAHTLKLVRSLTVPCAGVNHLDFSPSGSYAIASCEFSGQLLKVDVRHFRVLAVRSLPRSFSVPQDVRSSPDAKVFYVADLAAAGVWEVNPGRFKIIGFIHTGAGAHGLVVGRNGKVLYVANRNAGSVSVISFRKRKVIRTWRIPGGGSPDMGDVSADGRVLWLSGRYNAEVYALNTRTGRLIARIPVGASPHGLCVWPQPGRYSIGHTGNMR
ncbi:MAG: YncE family protein [Actinobacteria bacterium]|nr:MAG: YncE family protein [Actinomycetota bacterium]